MSIDSTELGQLVATFMDDLEKDYGEDAALEDAVIIVEVTTEDEDTKYGTVEARSISNRPVVEVGLTTKALDILRGTIPAGDED